MKNILKYFALFLALCCVLSAVACKNKKGNGNGNGSGGDHVVEPGPTVEYVAQSFGQSDPTKIVTTAVTNVTFNGSPLTLTSTETLQIAANGYAKYTASFEHLSDPTGEKPVSKLEVTEYSDPNGKVYDSESKAYKTQRPSTANTFAAVNLGEAGGTVTESEGGYLFTASFAASKSASVLGTAVEANGNISLSVFILDGAVETVTVSYLIEGGSVTVTSDYTYNTESFSHP